MPQQTHQHTATPEVFRARRAMTGVSRFELARLALVDPSTIYRLERGNPVSRLSRARITAALVALEETA